MPRFIRIGRFIFNADYAPKVTGLEESFIVTGEAAEKLQAYLSARAVPWKPVVIGPSPRGPLNRFPPRSQT